MKLLYLNFLDMKGMKAHPNIKVWMMAAYYAVAGVLLAAVIRCPLNP
jgi:hypothetical protein